VHPALLVIDMQRWFFKPLADQAPVRELIAGTNELIDFFHGRGLPIVHILTVHKADGSTGNLWMRRNDSISLVEGTPDAEECPGIHRFADDVEIIKTRHSAFIRTDLEYVLLRMGVDAAVIAGYSTNLCVGLSAIEAYDRDFDVLIARDAILGRDQERADVMLRLLRNEFTFEPVSNSVIIERVSAARS
jgi:nicotinamidase-related amidase